jgi:hypothetical protein
MTPKDALTANHPALGAEPISAPPRGHTHRFQSTSRRGGQLETAMAYRDGYPGGVRVIRMAIGVTLTGTSWRAWMRNNTCQESGKPCGPAAVRSCW